MQEAHRPRRIKYSICCPVREVPLPGGVPLPGVGVPLLGVQSVEGTPAGGTPSLLGGTPPQVPHHTWLGYPSCPRLDGVPPPRLDLTGVPPLWTDRQTRVKT